MEHLVAMLPTKASSVKVVTAVCMGLVTVFESQAANECRETGFNDKMFRTFLEECMG